MKTTYEQIVDVKQIGKPGSADLNDILSLAKVERLRTASQDTKKRLLLCIDLQKDFMEGGALAVKNSIKDVENITRFIYNNMENITRIICSMDTHYRRQIFHPCWWVNKKGKHPEPYTIITYDDILAGKWKTAYKDNHKSSNYLKALKKSGQKQLCIWPYHCLRGTDGYTLENQFARIVRFHSAVKITEFRNNQKRAKPFTEMYGILYPEYSEEELFNNRVAEIIEEYDEIYVVGEAASHCVAETLKQIVQYFSNKPDIIKKITVLTDCTSPIEGFEEETKKTFEKLNKKYGMKFKKSTDIHLEE